MIREHWTLVFCSLFLFIKKLCKIIDNENIQKIFYWIRFYINRSFDNSYYHWNIISNCYPKYKKGKNIRKWSKFKKILQVLRDAEYQYFEQDLDEDNIRDYTAFINTDGGSLRFPFTGSQLIDSLVDDSIGNAVVDDGNQSTESICTNPKAGYCISWTTDFGTEQQILISDFGWEVSPMSIRKTGRRDFSVYSDTLIRCTISSLDTGSPGDFSSNKNDLDCN